MVRKAGQRRNEGAIALLAANMRKFRLERNLTIQQLADLLEVDYSQISRMERKVVNPTISVIFDIAEALDIAPHKLLEPINPSS
jgi:transcriptional regulator with XRE-family HTH domain